jgi:hypothetical protein
MNFLTALWAWLNIFRKDEETCVYFYVAALVVILCLLFAPVGTFVFSLFVVGLWAALYWAGLVGHPDDLGIES